MEWCLDLCPKQKGYERDGGDLQITGFWFSSSFIVLRESAGKSHLHIVISNGSCSIQEECT